MKPSPHVTPTRPPGASAAQTRGRQTVPVTDVDIVIPVYNEQAVLSQSVRRLHHFLSTELPFSWRIIVADNASTDVTPAIARGLADELPGVTLLRLETKGRGRALRAAWSASAARVVCYMDADLSTDLRALLPLIAPLLSGHSDLAIGTRLARGARVARGAKREFISRSYNRLLRVALGAKFSDAQCVDWIEDPDSSVDIPATVRADLRGVARMTLATPIARFIGVGVLSTLAYALIFVTLSAPLGPAVASALALALTAVGNTAVNRRLTFGVRGREGLLGQHAAGALIFAIALGLTSGALAVLHGLDPRAPRAVELVVLVIANLAATVTRYAALRRLVFNPPRRAPEARFRGPVSPVPTPLRETIRESSR
jgi:putative flippase GtrA